MDILAAALHSYRINSLALRRGSVSKHDHDRSQRGLVAALRTIFSQSDLAPHLTAAQLADDALAELSRSGLVGAGGVGAAQAWITDFGDIIGQTDSPEVADIATRIPDGWEEWQLGQDVQVRAELLRALKQTGCIVPAVIRKRGSRVIDEPPSQEELDCWVRELLSPDDPAQWTTAHTDRTSSSGPLPQAKQHNSGGTDLAELLAVAGELGIKGKGREIIERITRDGSASIPDLTTLFDWSNPNDNWNSASQRLNRKLRTKGWELFRHDGVARARKL